MLLGKNKKLNRNIKLFVIVKVITDDLKNIDTASYLFKSEEDAIKKLKELYQKDLDMCKNNTYFKDDIDSLREYYNPISNNYMICLFNNINAGFKIKAHIEEHNIEI